MSDRPAAMNESEHRLLSHFLSPGAVVTEAMLGAVHAYRNEVLRAEAVRLRAAADARYERHCHEYGAAEVYRPEGMRVAADLIDPDVP